MSLTAQNAPSSYFLSLWEVRNASFRECMLMHEQISLGDVPSALLMKNFKVLHRDEGATLPGN